MIPKPFSEISSQDIENLCANKVMESRSLEYKAELSIEKDGERREFLRDIASFANSGGGDLIFGITEAREPETGKTGWPDSIVGVGNPSGETLTQIENMIRDGIEPRLKIEAKFVNGFTDEAAVLVIRIPLSLTAPHMVRYMKKDSFFSRNSAGKYPMDIGEIRSAFLASEVFPEKIRKFRRDRTDRIIAGDTTVALFETPKTVLHLIPQTAILNSPTAFGLPLPDGIRSKVISLWGDFRYNFDGFYSSRFGSRQAPDLYVQVYRNGIVELVDSRCIDDQKNTEKHLPSIHFCKTLTGHLGRIVQLLRVLEVDAPVYLLASILGVKGYWIYIDEAFRNDMSAIDRDHLLVPELLIEDLTGKPEMILKPVFDMIWQAGGLERCNCYNSDGNWKPRG